MSANRLYHTWSQQIRQLLPDEPITRVRDFVWLVVGIYQSRSVHLSHIASKIPGRAKEPSIVRRLSRLLAYPGGWVRKWYAPIAKKLLQSMIHSVGEIRLIADGTEVGFNHQLLIIAIAYRRRALPMAWTWIRCAKGAVPANNWPCWVTCRGWSLKRCPFCWAAPGRFDPQARAEHLVGTCLLDGQVCPPSQPAGHWEVGQDEPWLLATNLPSRGVHCGPTAAVCGLKRCSVT